MKHLKPRRKGQEGFSIVEAAVSVAISGIVLAAAIPTFKGVMGKSYEVQALSQMSATVKEAYSANLSGEDPSILPAKLCPTDNHLWMYGCTSSESAFTIHASPAGSAGQGGAKTLNMKVEYDTGIKTITRS